MKPVGSLCHLIARALERVGLLLYRLGTAFHNLLPVLLTPRDSSALLSRYYASTYYSAESLDGPNSPETLGFELESWEIEACNRYGLVCGRMLVLGCGWGREAIGIAERGGQVIGLDRHPGVLRLASRAAAERNVPARFLRGDFLALPCKPASFDTVLLSGTMYSAIPGRETRQGWLQQMRGLCKPDGLIILSFQTDSRPDGRLDRLAERLGAVLLKLPGTNPQYQKGDVCQGGHFFHLFRDETELKAEFDGAGAHLKELNWPRQYAILTAHVSS